MTRLRTPLIVLMTAVLVAVALVGLVLSMTVPSTDLPPVSRAIYLSNPIVIGLLAGILLIRIPGHWAGRTMLAITIAFDADSLSKAVLAHHGQGETWTLSLVHWAAWLDNWTWTIIFMGTMIVILKFAGTDRHGRWLRVLGWIGAGNYAVMMVIAALVSDSVDFGGVRTVVDIGLTSTKANTEFGVLFIAGDIGIVAAVIALVVRWRRAIGTERAQLRWLMWSFGSIIAAGVLDGVTSSIVSAVHAHAGVLTQTTDAVQELSVFTVPFAIFVSVTRYGLFEIDRVVSRTVSYTLLTVLLTVSYVAVVTSASRLVPDRLGSLPVAAATLAVAALFVPVRRRLVATIDHRFNRARYDAELVIGGFAERVRHEGANDPHGGDLLAAVQQVFQPAVASVWLLPSSRANS